jgi:hypothetical protein
VGQTGDVVVVGVLDHRNDQVVFERDRDAEVDALLQDHLAVAPGAVEHGVLAQRLDERLADEGDVGQVEALALAEGLALGLAPLHQA